MFDTPVKRKRALAHAGLLSVQLCFSGWHIIGSMALKDGADPLVFALYRELLATIGMMFIVLCKYPRFSIESKDHVRFVCLGFFSFVNVVGAVMALKYIPATTFSIFQPCIPCVATLISIIIRIERFSYLKAIGILLAVSGAIITEVWGSDGSVDDDDKADSFHTYVGSAIVSAQVIGMACLVVFSKPILSKYPPAIITFVYYSIGTIFTIILFAAMSFTLTVSEFYFNSGLSPWLGLIYVAFVATIYPYNVYSWAGKQLTPSAVTVYSTCQPVGTMLLSLLFLGKMITLSEGVGTAMVITGLIITIIAQTNEAPVDDTGKYHTITDDAVSLYANASAPLLGYEESIPTATPVGHIPVLHTNTTTGILHMHHNPLRGGGGGGEAAFARVPTTNSVFSNGSRQSMYEEDEDEAYIR